MKIDLKDPTAQRTIMIVLVVIFALYFFNSQVYSKRKEELVRLREEYNGLNTQYINARRTASSLPALEKENRRLTEKWKALKKILPEEKDLPELIDQVSRAGYLTDLEFKSFVPQKANHLPFYDESSFKIKVVGGYHDLGAFFCKLGAMERIVKVTDLNIEPYKSPELRGKTVASEFMLRTYVLFKGGERTREEGK